MPPSNFLSRSFPPPAFMRMPAVGLDISHRSVRFVELLRSVHGLSLGRHGERRFAATASYAEDVSENKELRAALVSLKHDFKFQFVNVSLPEDKAFLFSLSLPRVEPAKMREAIEFQLEENVPMAPSEVVFDYTQVSADASSAASGRVVVTAYPKRIIDNYRRLFADVGLVPLSFTLSAEAISSAVVPSGSTGTVLIVNIGMKSTGIYVVVDGVLQFTSTLSFGGEALTSAIAKHFNVSQEQALEIKNSDDFLKRKNTMQLFFSMANAVSALRDEIARVAAYWQTHKGGKGAIVGMGMGIGMGIAAGDASSLRPQTQIATALAPETDAGSGERIALDPKLINKVILCGADAHLRGLDQYLLTTLNVPVEVANIWTNAFSLDRTIPEIHFANSLDYAAAAGLSLETLHSQTPHA